MLSIKGIDLDPYPAWKVKAFNPFHQFFSLFSCSHKVTNTASFNPLVALFIEELAKVCSFVIDKGSDITIMAGLSFILVLPRHKEYSIFVSLDLFL